MNKKKQAIRDGHEVFSLLDGLTKKLIEKGLERCMGEYITNEPVDGKKNMKDIFCSYSRENWNWKRGGGRLVIRVGVEPLESSPSYCYFGLCLYKDDQRMNIPKGKGSEIVDFLKDEIKKPDLKSDKKDLRFLISSYFHKFHSGEYNFSDEKFRSRIIQDGTLMNSMIDGMKKDVLRLADSIEKFLKKSPSP